MKTYRLMLAALACALLTPAVHAADLAAGQKAFTEKTCVTCHGEDAKTSVLETYPILAGQHADYISHALHAYRRAQAGAGGISLRANPVMGAMAAQLSDADIENIAAWLATLPSGLAVSH
jgi:cytochrome c553